jgi:RNA polymerase sigma factor (sigma-70 family)
MKTAFELVDRVLREVGAPFDLREELAQEALLYLWQQESLCPGQTATWYLKGCKFHLLDYLRRGRSVDAFKRRHKACELSGEDDGDHRACNHPIEEEAARSSATASDMRAVLERRLSRRQQEILALLEQGYGPVKVAGILGISQPAVSKERPRIVSVAVRCGFSPS